MSNFFLRILQSDFKSQGLISMYPLNEASQDPTGLKNNGSKITELLILGLVLWILCKVEGPSSLRITSPCDLHFNSILLPLPGLCSSSHLLSLRVPILLREVLC